MNTVLKVLNNLIGAKIGKRRFYNRLFFMNAIVFILVLFLFATIMSRLSFQVESARIQQKNREVLQSVCDYYNVKHNEYVNMVYPLYDDRTTYTIMSDLLEGNDASDFESDPFLRKDIAERMGRLIARDNDVEAIYFISNETNRQYAFMKRYNTFEQIFSFGGFSERAQKPVIGRVPLGFSYLGEKATVDVPGVYGIVSSVGTMNITNNAGKMIIAYNIKPLQKVFDRFRNSAVKCLIVSDEGVIIFSSSGDYSEKKFDQMPLLQYDATETMFHGEKNIVLTYANPARKYTGILLIPSKLYLSQAIKTSVPIFLSCLGFAVLTILLYLFAGMRVSYRVRELEDAMDLVGSNQLSYRIPMKGNEDEFDHIAAFYNRMCNDLQNNIDRLYLSEIKEKNAALGALQARINPHFLYNSLEAIRARVQEDGNVEASDMIAQLASMYRSITKEKMVYTIQQEIQFIKIYLNLFSFRHGDDFDVSINMDANIMSYGILKYLLQPVIENYFVHGYRTIASEYRQEKADSLHTDASTEQTIIVHPQKLETKRNHLTIIGKKIADDIVIKVCDNGKGIEKQRLEILRESLNNHEEQTASFGLKNVHERIQLVFGKECGLRVESEPGASTCFTLHIKALTCEEIEKIRMKKTETGIS